MKHNAAHVPKAKVLVVDDETNTLQLLVNLLTMQGCEVFSTRESISALRIAEETLPDLILLDVMLPETDGFEVCKQLKANPDTENIPVIFMTALGDAENKARGFAVGAVDYIAKPFEPAEVLARVKTHLSIYDMQKQLAAKNAQLQEGINRRKQAEEALLLSEEIYRLTLTNISDAVFITDEIGTFKFICPNVDIVFGYGFEEVQHLDNISRLLGDDLFVLDDLRVSGELKNIERAIVDKAGRFRTVLVTVKEVSIAGGTRLYTCHEITDRKQADQALKASEEKYRSLAENINDVIFSLNAQGCFTYVSPVIERLARYQPGDLIGQTFAMIVHPDDLEMVTASFEETLAGTGTPLEFRISAKDGEAIYIRTSSRPIQEGGQVVGLTGIATDISDRRAVEAALRESEARYREGLQQTEAALAETQALYKVAHSLIGYENLSGLLQGIVDGVADTLPANRVVLFTFDLAQRRVTQEVKGGPGVAQIGDISFDEVWEGLWGWALRERKPALSPMSEPDPREDPAVRRRRAELACGAIIVVPLFYHDTPLGVLTAINRPDEREFTEHDLSLMLAMSSQAPIVIENARLYEEVRRANTDLERRVNERTAELAAANTKLTDEIAERKKAEEASFNSSQMLRLVLDSIPQCVFWKDRNSIYVGCNKPLALDCGYTDPAELIGKDDYQTTSAAMADRYRADDRAVMESRQPRFNYEEPQLRSDGSEGWLVTSKMPLFDKDGQVIGILGTYEDITERRRAEHALRRLNRAHQATSRCNQALLRAAREDDLLHDVCRIIREECGYPWVWVGYAEHDAAKSVRPVAQAGYEDGYLESLHLTWADTEQGRGPTGIAIRTGSPSLNRDALNNPAYARWRNLALKIGYASSVALPLVTGGQILGALNVYSTTTDSFDADEVELLTDLAGDLAYGISSLRVEQALQASERRYELLVESMNDGLSVIDAEGRFAYVNRRFGEMIGRPPEDLIGQPLQNYLDVSNQAILAQQIPRRQEGKGSVYELSWTRDGGPIPTLMSGRPLFDERGNFTGSLAVVTDITERKEAERALQITRQRLEDIIEFLPDATFVIDENQRVVAWNRALETMTGVPKEAIIGKGDQAYAVPFYGKTRTALIDFIGQEEPVNDDQYDYVRKFHDTLYAEVYVPALYEGTGAYIWITASPLFDKNGNRYGAIECIRDISERKKIEAAEREQRALANALRDTITALTGTLEPDLVMTRILEYVGRVVPHDRANIMLIEGDSTRCAYWHNYPAGYEAFFARFRLPLTTPNLQEMIAEGRPVLVADTRAYPDWIRTPETTEILSHIAAPIRRRNRVIGFLNLDSLQTGFFTQEHAERLQVFADQAALALENAQLYDEVRQYADQLEQRVNQRTAELNDAKERVEVILNSSSDVIILSSADGLIRQTNPVFSQLFGYVPDVWFNQPLRMLVRPDNVPLLTKALDSVVETKQATRLELVALGNQEATFDADVAISPILEEDGQIRGLVCSFRDITARKRMENDLRQMLEREMSVAELRSRFISIASHELRTPLAVIQFSSDLLARYADRISEEKRQDELSQITKSVKHMVTLLDDVLMIGKANSGRLELTSEPINLENFCREILTEIQHSFGMGHHFVFSCAGEVRIVNMDQTLLRHILGNLLSNAVKYSPVETTVTFTVTYEAAQVVFCVADQGIGIPEADQPHLFEPFYRAKNVRLVPGTGLGLAIVKQSVDRHGGAIHFETQPGKGTTFTVSIPTSPE